MNDLGFFCINRKIFEHEIWKDPEKARAWIELIGLYARGRDNCTLKRGQFKASYSEMARRWGWSVDKVRGFLEYLKAESMIEVVASGSNQHNATMYQVANYEKYNGIATKRQTPTKTHNPTVQPTVQPTVNPMSDLLFTETQPTVQPTVNPTAEFAYKEETKKNKNTYSSSANKPTYPSAFEEFWVLYPRKVGKAEAYRVWLRIRPSPDLHDRILRSLEIQKASAQWIKNQGEYIPHPRTWLHQGRWDDEPIQVSQQRRMSSVPVYQG